MPPMIVVSSLVGRKGSDIRFASRFSSRLDCLDSGGDSNVAGLGSRVSFV